MSWLKTFCGKEAGFFAARNLGQSRQRAQTALCQRSIASGGCANIGCLPRHAFCKALALVRLLPNDFVSERLRHWFVNVTDYKLFICNCCQLLINKLLKDNYGETKRLIALQNNRLNQKQEICTISLFGLPGFKIYLKSALVSQLFTCSLKKSELKREWTYFCQNKEWKDKAFVLCESISKRFYKKIL